MKLGRLQLRISVISSNAPTGLDSLKVSVYIVHTTIHIFVLQMNLLNVTEKRPSVTKVAKILQPS